MKRRLIALFILLLLLALTVSVASAQGRTQAQAEAAGWFCGDEAVDTPPPGHCFHPGTVFGSPTLNVSVFSVVDGSFEGTEILWREDIYGGQPCPQSDLLTPDDLGMPYYACHHYEE